MSGAGCVLHSFQTVMYGFLMLRAKVEPVIFNLPLKKALILSHAPISSWGRVRPTLISILMYGFVMFRIKIVMFRRVRPTVISIVDSDFLMFLANTEPNIPNLLRIATTQLWKNYFELV